MVKKIEGREREKLIKNLLKRAEGYTVEETTLEYAIDEDGNRRAVKERTQNKYYPPDTNALKAYLELTDKDNEFMKMSDEELEEEKKRLLASLFLGKQ